MTDFRALCAELLSALENEGYAHWTVVPDEDELCLRARAALAQPEPERLTDEATELAAWLRNQGVTHASKLLYSRAADLIEGRPAIKPIAVGESLPGPEDCDAEGRCWLWAETLGGWIYRSSGHIHSGITHWLPAYALPLPANHES